VWKKTRLNMRNIKTFEDYTHDAELTKQLAMDAENYSKAEVLDTKKKVPVSYTGTLSKHNDNYYLTITNETNKKFPVQQITAAPPTIEVLIITTNKVTSADLDGYLVLNNISTYGAFLKDKSVDPIYKIKGFKFLGEPVTGWWIADVVHITSIEKIN